MELSDFLAKIRASGRTIAVAESLTAGHVQAALSSESGASAFFLGGVTAYNLDQKVRLLGVDRKHASGCDCVSRQVALEMAAGVRKLFHADVGVATTGYAEVFHRPDGTIFSPHAYCAIIFGGQKDTTVTAMINAVPLLTRVEVQETVTYQVLKLLAYYS